MITIYFKDIDIIKLPDGSMVEIPAYRMEKAKFIDFTNTQCFAFAELEDGSGLCLEQDDIFYIGNG